jgi:hypothetical protein
MNKPWMNSAKKKIINYNYYKSNMKNNLIDSNETTNSKAISSLERPNTVIIKSDRKTNRIVTSSYATNNSVVITKHSPSSLQNHGNRTPLMPKPSPTTISP